MHRTTRMSKTEARSKFLPLVHSVATTGDTVEITDHGKIAVVLLSHQEYSRLLALAQESPPARRSPVGTVVLLEELEGDQSTANLLLGAMRARASRP